MDVSIIIVNYNTQSMTLECINSVFEKTKDIRFEVILIDNASTDGSKEFFEKDQRILYFYNTENLGFGKANNAGLKYAKGRNILFLNSDTLLINDAISILSHFLDTHNDVGACGGNLFSLNYQPLHSYRRLSPLIFELNTLLSNIPTKLFYKKNEEHNHSSKPMAVNTIVGADLMIRKSILTKIGGAFDERFFMYCEETELCHRIRKANYKIMSVPDAKIIHLEGASFSEDKKIKRIKMNRDSTRLYCLIHYNKFYANLVDLVWKVTIYSRIVVYSLTKSPKKKFWTAIKNECFKK